MATELRQILVETCARLFADHVTKELSESAERGTWPAALWQTVEESGLTLPQVPEERGGAGGSWLDAHVVLVAAGRFAVPVPLGETMLAGSLLARAGLDAPTGPLTIAPVERGERLRLERDGSAWRLSGTATRVPWGRDAAHVVVVADAGDGQTLIGLVGRDSARVTQDRNLALEPRDTLVWDRSPVTAAAPAPGLEWDQVQAYGAMVRAAQMAGGLEFLLAETTRYVGERRQFGRPIGSFQAIQHNLAVLAGHTAAAGMAAAAAFRAAERGDPAFEAAAAKIRVGEAAGIGAGIAHQSHGAIGFTYEHHLHFVTRRLWSWRAEFGGEGEWSLRLGRQVCARGADQLWADVTAR
jgi:acyl-CoA dehydrogenase